MTEKNYITYLTDFAPSEDERVLICFEWHESMGRWMSDVYTITREGILISNGNVSQGKTLEGCKRGFNRVAKRYFGEDVALVRVVLEGEKLVSYNYTKSFFTDPNDESVHENFKAWARGLFEVE